MFVAFMGRRQWRRRARRGAEHDIETSGNLSVDDRDARYRPDSGSCRRRTAQDGAAARAKRGRAAGRSAVGSAATAKRKGRRGEASARVEGGL